MRNTAAFIEVYFPEFGQQLWALLCLHWAGDKKDPGDETEPGRWAMSLGESQSGGETRNFISQKTVDLDLGHSGE